MNSLVVALTFKPLLQGMWRALLCFSATLVVVKLRNAPCDSHPRERSEATIDWKVANR